MIHSYTASLRLLPAQLAFTEDVFYVVKTNRRIIILQFICFGCFSHLFLLFMSYHEETISYTVYFMGDISVTLHKGTMALVPRVHLSLPGARNNLTCNLHFKGRCRVVKATNWRKGKNGRKNVGLGSGGQRQGDSRQGTEVVFVW